MRQLLDLRLRCFRGHTELLAFVLLCIVFATHSPGLSAADEKTPDADLPKLSVEEYAVSILESHGHDSECYVPYVELENSRDDNAEWFDILYIPFDDECSYGIMRSNFSQSDVRDTASSEIYLQWWAITNIRHPYRLHVLTTALNAVSKEINDSFASLPDKSKCVEDHLERLISEGDLSHLGFEVFEGPESHAVSFSVPFTSHCSVQDGIDWSPRFSTIVKRDPAKIFVPEGIDSATTGEKAQVIDGAQE